MNIAIALVVFIVAALIVWGCAELNYKNKELNIRDIMRDNSTKGYAAV